MHLLLVEDDARLARALTRLLRDDRHVVDVAGDGDAESVSPLKVQRFFRFLRAYWWLPILTMLLLVGAATNAIDGKRLIGNWRDFFPTTWVADSSQPLPQWLEIDLAGPKKLTSITVYTVAFATWTPDSSGIRAWDVQVWDGKAWLTVDSVTDNVRVSKITRLKTPVTTDKIRIVVNRFVKKGWDIEPEEVERARTVVVG